MTTGAMGDDEGLLTEQDAAELLQVPLSTLRRWRREGAGPPCLKIGRPVRYRQVAVQRWLTGGLQAGSQTRTASTAAKRSSRERAWVVRVRSKPTASLPIPAPAAVVWSPTQGGSGLSGWRLSPDKDQHFQR